MKALIVFGTRPEAVKLAPVVSELRSRPGIEAIVCVTAQHREMLDQVLRVFAIPADIDLDLMQSDQSLDQITSDILRGVARVIGDTRPDVVVVQGDTTTAMASGLAAFFSKVPLAHVEAGLRTGIRSSPYPEELMRRVVSQIAQLHFAPTIRAAENLRREGIDAEGAIYLTGNTVVDAIQLIIAQRGTSGHGIDRRAERLILVTAHRRENFGRPISQICTAVRTLVESHSDIEVVYPVHLNPNVRGPVHKLLGGHERIHLVEPLDYQQLVYVLADSYLVLTDSGGLQEEAPVLGRPVLVLRKETERPEAVEIGAAILVGTEAADIVRETERLLNDRLAYRAMTQSGSPFGDGYAAPRIADILDAWHANAMERVAAMRWTGTGRLAPYRRILASAP